MKKLFLNILGIGLLTAFVGGITVSTCLAEDKPAAGADAGKDAGKKPKQAPYHGKVAKVDKDAQTITLEGKTTARTFHVTEKTRILKGDQKVTLENIAVGEEVRGLAREVDGKWEAASLYVGAKPAGEAKSKKEKKQ